MGILVRDGTHVKFRGEAGTGMTCQQQATGLRWCVSIGVVGIELMVKVRMWLLVLMGLFYCDIGRDRYESHQEDEFDHHQQGGHIRVEPHR